MLAHAQAGGEVHRSPHMHGSRWIAGAKALALGVIESDGKEQAGVGAGISLERNLIEGWLELELVASAVRLEGAWVYPVELLLKKPLHFGFVCPYFGLGPAATIAPDSGEHRVAWGLAAAAGAYFWLGDRFGIDAELTYSLLDEGGAAHELTLAAGPALRF